MKNNTKKTTENEIIVNEELKSQNNQEVAAEFQPGSHRVQQVVDTIEFEFIRNKKKTLIIMAVDAIVFLLFFIIEQTRQSRGAEACADPVAYVNSYLGMIDLLILITACSFG